MKRLFYAPYCSVMRNRYINGHHFAADDIAFEVMSQLGNDVRSYAVGIVIHVVAAL